VVAEDARVVQDELLRLRRLAARVLLLASAGSPDFLHLAPVAVEPLVVDTLGRWSHTPRRWWQGAVAETTVLGDHDRLALALDALLENAVAHTDVGDRIEVSARLEDAHVVLCWATWAVSMHGRIHGRAAAIMAMPGAGEGPPRFRR
jgi:signal transduction histidine kinase